MISEPSTAVWPRAIGFLLLLVVPVILAVSLVWLMFHLRRGDVIGGPNHVYLLSGTTGSGPLMSLQWMAGGQSLEIIPAGIQPIVVKGSPTIESGSSRTLLLGSYYYRFSNLPTGDGTTTKQRLEWELIGVRMRTGDEVGRSPSFVATGRLGYEPEASLDNSSMVRYVPVWFDAVPANVFLVRKPSDCSPTAISCLEITGGVGRITIETAGSSRRFHHPKLGERVSVGENDRVWIAHLSFHILPVKQRADEVDMMLAEDHEIHLGDRRGLGSFGFHGSTGVLDTTAPIVVDDVASEYKAGHLSNFRWDPETEDEYQLLIDSGLLCLSTSVSGPGSSPQLVWSELTNPRCGDPLTSRASTDEASFQEALVQVYRRRRRNDQLVERTNERLRTTTAIRPEDIPFVFEWWTVKDGDQVKKLPIRLWGTRTNATYRELDPEHSPMAARVDPSARSVVVTSRTGRKSTLASGLEANRAYAKGQDMLGLGPLLGIRGSVDGLDNVVQAIPVSVAPEEINLTIDPDLQSLLWRALKAQAGKADDAEGRLTYGVSAVALNASNGNVLAVLNWPNGLLWEDSKSFERLRNRTAWGVPSGSLNNAMLRAEKVGSVFKLLAMYAMADSGALDAAPQTGQLRFCGTAPFGALMTGPDGVVHPMGSPSIFQDDQNGPLPTGIGGLNNGLDAATGASCNTYFGLAATMLLDPMPKETIWMAVCPIDVRLRRTDSSAVSSRQWIVCNAAPTVQDRLAHRVAERVNWLLFPQGEDLASRSLEGFRQVSKHAPGYFGRALDAGFWFGFHDYGEEKAAYWHGAGADAYEGVSYWRAWMPDIPGAEGRLFNYPMMLSPRSQFGGGNESYGIASSRRVAAAAEWREFASQAIGEAGQGSALSVAVMYSAIARNDGNITAPRLLDVPSTPPSLKEIFEFSPQRLERLQEALRVPLASGTAASSAGRFVREHEITTVLGKTGTFKLTHRLMSVAHQGSATENQLVACGALEIDKGVVGPSPSPAWGSQIGSQGCENAGLMVTGVHRYPEGEQSDQPLPTAEKVRTVQEKDTSFAAVILPPSGSAAPPVVIALIVDTPKLQAHTVIQPLLLETWNWMRGFR